MAKNICIPRESADALKNAMKSGKFSIEDVKKMSSEDRIAEIQKYIADEDVAKKLNNGFETRINAKANETIRRYLDKTVSKNAGVFSKDVADKIARMKGTVFQKENGNFVSDLAERRMGMQLTSDEVTMLVKASEDVIESRKLAFKAFRDGIPADDIRRTAWGDKQAHLADLIETIQLGKVHAGNKGTLARIKNAEGAWKAYQVAVVDEGWNAFVNALGAVKGIKASLDNSVFGRQLLPTLYRSIPNLLTGDVGTFNMYWKTWRKSWSDMGVTLKSGEIDKWAKEHYGITKRKNPIQTKMMSEYYASDNYLNGKYHASKNKYGLETGGEEAFPIALPERIQGFGRLYKASEVAYNVSAFRMRRHLADKFIAEMEAKGVNMLKAEDADALGELVASLTGRGTFGEGGERAAGLFGTMLFSPRFMKSQIDVLYQPLKMTVSGQVGTSAVARKVALEQTKYLTTVMGALAIGAAFGVTSIDPRDNRFGKLIIGDRTFDITGGSATFWGTLIKAVSPVTYDGKLGVWKAKSFLQKDNFNNIMDVLFTNKLAPVPALLRDIAKGEHFGGIEVSAKSVVSELLLPITVQSVFEKGWSERDLSAAWIVLLADGMGISTQDFIFKPQTADWKALMQSDPAKYNRATKELWAELQPVIQQYRGDASFQKADEATQSKILLKEYEKMQKAVVARHPVED